MACALTTSNAALCWGVGYQNYPTLYGVSDVVALGTMDNAGAGIVRVLTSDGLYHIGTTTRAPNCGLLQ